MILLMLLLLTSNAYADTYEKIDAKTVKVTQTQEQTYNIDYIKSERQKALDTCTAQVSAQYDSLISEAKKSGVQ